jgi:hypothetical protein
MPNIQVLKGSLQIRDNRMWPALILAKRRKHRVIGRTKILINSTTLRKGIKYQGELEGSSAAEDLGFIRRRLTLANHRQKAPPKLKDKVVVTGYLYPTKEVRLNKAITTNILMKTDDK